MFISVVNISYAWLTNSGPFSCGIFVNKFDTSIGANIVSLHILVLSIKLIKSVT